MSQIVSELPTTPLPSINLECDEELEDTVSDQPSAPNATIEPNNLKYDYTPVDLTKVTYLSRTDLGLFNGRLVPKARAILLDWMSEVCTDYGLTRETFYLAATFITRYFLACEAERKVFQLIAVAALSLAAKVEEENAPKMARLSQSCGKLYSVEDIKSMEQQMLGVLEWRIDTVTSANILQWLMTRWDNFLTSSTHPLTPQPDSHWITFTSWTPSSALRLQESFLLLDAIQLHPTSLLHPPLQLTLTLFYLLISHYFQQTDYSLLHSAMAVDCSSKLSLCTEVAALFSGFLRQVVDKPVDDLNPEIQLFLLPFFTLLYSSNIDSGFNPQSDEKDRKLWAGKQRHYRDSLPFVVYLHEHPAA